MAYTAGNLVLLSNGNGFGHYRYDTLDAHASVDDVGYFNNVDDELNLAVGDIIDVVVWLTEVRAPGTVTTYGRHIVNEVTAAGVVDLTNVTIGLMTDTN